jgi:hypothetical protein
MAKRINLAEREGFNLELTDKEGKPIVSIFLARGVEDLPQLQINRFTTEGEIDTMFTVFGLENV